ncbi:MAG: hypothetical protein COA69_05715 [Robiginitomaculum sp.]|nr:MAG: hypothetical protein COA69_05715 [Robiginitomaculum sp.]
MELINNWTDENRQNYGKQVMAVQHSLNKTGLFTDEALEELLDIHPAHLIDFQAFPNDDPDFPDQQVTVDFSGASSATMIAAAKSKARIWINVREAMNTHPKYKAVLDQLHEELAHLTGKNISRRKSRGGILISSATAATPYHSDPTLTHLWHIRGHKRAWVYPVNQTFLPDSAFESIVLGEIDEDVAYRPEFDESAGVYDLMGGEMVSWPHRSPHRVENQSYCVSMVMEFSTLNSAFINAGMFANGILRRQYGRNPSWKNASLPEKVFKAAMGRTLRTLGVRKSFRRKDMVRYKIDETSPGFIRPVKTPYERVH